MIRRLGVRLAFGIAGAIFGALADAWFIAAAIGFLAAYILLFVQRQLFCDERPRVHELRPRSKGASIVWFPQLLANVFKCQTS